MQKFLTSISNVNKPLAYGGMKNMIRQQQVANITCVQLNEQPLPKQPVPDLIKTVELYLKSVQPLLNKVEYENTKRLVRDLVKEGGIGQQLYHKLQEKYEKTENWMSDWWLEAAYLGYRYPVIVHSSPGTVGPSQDFKTHSDLYECAAYIIKAVCKYDLMIKSGKIKQETMRGVPLDMQPYAMILGTHRQPNRGVDKLVHTDNADHVIVISNNHFFKLTLSNTSEGQLAASIKSILERSRIPGKPIGILTGNDRDTWAEDHERLKNLGSNDKILKNLETALFVLCLDKELPARFFANKNNESVGALESLTGCSTLVNAANRWHDKTVQFIVSADGFVGMEYEHTPCEGLPISVLHDSVLNYIASKKTEKLDISRNFVEPEQLQFELNESLSSSIEKASSSVNELSQDIDMECFIFNEFGANEIKKNKLSPDSFIQIAMQLTYYKLHGKPPAHYESAALRRFKNARTECIRSTCNESVHFAKIMTEHNEPRSSRKAAMLAAIDAHKRLATEATLGQGVDRLLFGLKMMARDAKMALPEFFSDVGYKRSTYFTLTSSQVAFKTASFMCYGPVVPDGYGCCYNPRPDDMLFACSSFKSCPTTSTIKFADTLKQSLRIMKDLFN